MFTFSEFILIFIWLNFDQLRLTQAYIVLNFFHNTANAWTFYVLFMFYHKIMRQLWRLFHLYYVQLSALLHLSYTNKSHTNIASTIAHLWLFCCNLMHVSNIQSFDTAWSVLCMDEKKEHTYIHLIIFFNNNYFITTNSVLCR